MKRKRGGAVLIVLKMIKKTIHTPGVRFPTSARPLPPPSPCLLPRPCLPAPRREQRVPALPSKAELPHSMAPHTTAALLLALLAVSHQTVREGGKSKAHVARRGGGCASPLARGRGTSEFARKNKMSPSSRGRRPRVPLPPPPARTAWTAHRHSPLSPGAGGGGGGGGGEQGARCG